MRIDVGLRAVEAVATVDVVPDHQAVDARLTWADDHGLERRRFEEVRLVVGHELLIVEVHQRVDGLALRGPLGLDAVGSDPIPRLRDGHLAGMPRTDAFGHGVLVLIEHDQHDILQGRQPGGLVVVCSPRVGLGQVVVVVTRPGGNPVAAELGVRPKSTHRGVLTLRPFASGRLVRGAKHLFHLAAGQALDEVGPMVADVLMPVVEGLSADIEYGIDARTARAVAPEQAEELGVDQEQAVEGRAGHEAIEGLGHEPIEPLPIAGISLREAQTPLADVGGVEVLVDHRRVATHRQVAESDAIVPLEPVPPGLGLAAGGHPPDRHCLLRRGRARDRRPRRDHRPRQDAHQATLPRAAVA
jgi:hypothetical protein